MYQSQKELRYTAGLETKKEISEERLRTIAWDVDDVLNDLMRLWLKYWVKKHPKCRIKYNDIKVNPPHRIFGITLEQYRKSLDEFKKSGAYDRMAPRPEVMKWFRKYGKNFRHIALSAVSLSSASYSAGWVMKHFGKWIRTYHFVPSKRKGEKIPLYDKDKAAYLKRLSAADIIVEDNEQNIKLAKRIGIKGILIPRPWNGGKGNIEKIIHNI